jgi:hypothetical protein
MLSPAGPRTRTANSTHEDYMPITTGHTLLAGSWTANAEAVETAIRRFALDASPAPNCHVALFEIAGDERLHVNVTHRHPTKAVSGWAGPGSVPDGFVHNRTFSYKQSSRMIGHIRAMVFAARV